MPLNIFDGLVIEPIEVGVMVRFAWFRKAVIGGLIWRDRFG